MLGVLVFSLRLWRFDDRAAALAESNGALLHSLRVADSSGLRDGQGAALLDPLGVRRVVSCGVGFLPGRFEGGLGRAFDLFGYCELL
jgi:hypothetical protein